MSGECVADESVVGPASGLFSLDDAGIHQRRHRCAASSADVDTRVRDLIHELVPDHDLSPFVLA